MDEVDRELSRICKYTHRELPPVDWNKQRQIRKDEILTEDEISAAFYFKDRSGECITHGDTSLHRVLSTHAPGPAIESFLTILQHHQELARAGRNIFSMDSAIPCALLEEFTKMPTPPSLCHQNKKGVTALHMAIYRNSWHVETIVQMLMEMEVHQNSGQRLASTPMATGSYPLHVLCGHNMTIQKEVLKLLLQADPSVVWKDDCNGDNPFSLLWKNVLRFRWAVSLEQGYNDVDYVKSGMSWMTVIVPEQYLLYSLLMLKALRSCRGKNPTFLSHGFTLHEVCAIPRCPPLLLRLALMPKYRCSFDITGEASTVDEYGRLPLHYAVQMPTANKRFVPPYVERSSGGLESVVDILLDEYPEGLMSKDQQGRLPLHYALECGHIQEQSLCTMIRLYPDSLRMQDPVTRLFPFMLIAAVNTDVSFQSRDQMQVDEPHSEQTEWKKDHVRMCYHLLQLCPEAVQFQIRFMPDQLSGRIVG